MNLKVVKKPKMDLDSFKTIKKNIPANTKLIAVSKGQEVEKIKALYNEGHRDFGENFLQELQQKKAQLPKDIKWHFLGNIQSNKLKEICTNSELIHSISRRKIYRKLFLIESKTKINILLQLKLGTEESKAGFSKKEIYEIIDGHPDGSHVAIKGLMVIAEGNKSESEIKEQFDFAFGVYNEIKSFSKNTKILSMGMSGDYSVALESGSNMIRIGTSLFGDRYK